MSQGKVPCGKARPEGWCQDTQTQRWLVQGTELSQVAQAAVPAA
ncbi:MAG: hypothetical protein NTX64_19015 [Elusimicrobia bacterium]|nr:hypothetical protein [Elusimicrobiota bacterium]